MTLPCLSLWCWLWWYTCKV